MLLFNYKVKAEDPIPNETITEVWVDIKTDDTNPRIGPESDQAPEKAKSSDQAKGAGGDAMQKIEDLLAGKNPVLLAVVIIAGLALLAFFIGLVCNCVKRSRPPKDLDLDFAMNENSDEDDEEQDRGSRIMREPRETRTVERRSGVVSFLASIGRSSKTDCVASQTE